ncbi:MAG: hypothetical protein M1832_004557 [Thelocarpon impressellum]|nr:MAG: hypothetical protein M1832_004557 [Thelocarpon impressellum]
MASSSGEAGESQSYTTMDRGDVEAIGAHCEMPYCHQLDFLPFRCESCKSTFCLDHRTEFAHKCAHEGAWATARREQMLNAASTGKSTLRPVAETQCAHPQCKTAINTPGSTGVRCGSCNRQYCLRHRLNEDHDCAKLAPLGARPAAAAAFNAAAQTEKARAALSKLRAWGKGKQAELLPKARPSSNAARVVALNQLKRSAKGDAKTPADRRVYVHVEASADTTTSKFPRGDFFYARDWSVGRVLDAAARGLQVQNLNNRGGGEEERLRVFHVEGGRLLEFGERLGEAVASGDTVVLLRGVGPAVPDLIRP